VDKDLNQKTFFLQRILSIAANTFREAIRDRVLYNLIIFVLLITASAVLLSELTAGQEIRTIINLGLSAMLLFGAFIAIFVGVSLVSKEIEKRTVYSIFSKPIKRSEFIIGKYLGLCLTLLVNILIMGAGVTLALLYAGGKQFALNIWAAIVLIFLELTILTAVAILFSSFSSPALSALLTFLIFIIGHFSASLRDLAQNLDSQSARIFFEFLYYFLPNLSNYSFITNAAYGDLPSVRMLAGTFLYTIIYATVLLYISVFIFNRRNFK
jgi:ABC-type transport system involved in multi-copper enzyme maturation permease subunit